MRPRRQQRITEADVPLLPPCILAVLDRVQYLNRVRGAAAAAAHVHRDAPAGGGIDLPDVIDRRPIAHRIRWARPRVLVIADAILDEIVRDVDAAAHRQLLTQGLVQVEATRRAARAGVDLHPIVLPIVERAVVPRIPDAA